MPPNVKFPGVVVQELSSGAYPIKGVATSVTAFIGACPKGATCQPMQISAYVQYEEAFGGLAAGSELGYSVQQYFMNGGTSAWVVRVPDKPAEKDWRTGIHSLDAVGWFSLLVLPGVSQSAILKVAVEYCTRRRAFLLVDPPSSAKTQI